VKFKKQLQVYPVERGEKGGGDKCGGEIFAHAWGGTTTKQRYPQRQHPEGGKVKSLGKSWGQDGKKKR